MRVVDDKGQILDLPDEQAWAGLSSGKLGLEPGASVAVRSKMGQIGSIPAEDLQKALAEGFQPVSEQEYQTAQRRAEAETVPGALTASATKLASGASLGLSDVGIREIGGKRAAQYVKDAQEAFPTLSLVSEIAGAALPALATEGGSTAVSAGRAGLTGAREASLLTRAARGGLEIVSAPSRAAMGLGEATEMAMSRILGQEADNFLLRGLQRVVPAAARGTVEGAAQGLGTALSEDALSDHGISREAFIHHITTGAMMGAGLGGAMSGLGFVAKESTQALQRKLEAMSADGALDAVVDMYAKGSSFISGKDEGAIKRLLKDKEFRVKAVDDPTAIIHQSAFDVARDANAMDDTVRAIHKDVWGSGKAQQMRAKIPVQNFPSINNDAVKMLDEVKKIHAEMASKPQVYTQQRRVEKLGEIVEHLEKEVLTASNRGSSAGAHIFNEMNWAKQRIGKLAKTSAIPGVEEAVAERLQADVYDGLFKPFLEREDLFADAAIAQREVNALSRPSFGSQRAYERNFSKGTGKIDPHHDWLEVTESDPGKLANTLANLGTPQSHIDAQILRSHGENTIQALEAYKTHYDLAPKVTAKIDQGIASAKDYLATLDKATEHVGALRTLQSISGGTNGIGLALDVAGAVTGGIAGFGLGTLAKKGLDLLADPGNVVRKLAMLERLAGGLQGKVDGGLKGLLSTAKEGASRARNAAVPAAVRAFGSTPEERRKAFDDKRRAIMAAIENPARATAHLEQMRDAAPQLVDHARVQLTAQAKYLASKLPQPISSPSLQPGIAAKHARYSDDDISKFGRIWEAVRNPASVLSDLKRGTATRDQIEAMRVASPATFELAQKRARERIAEMDAKGHPLSYDQRLALSSLLGIDDADASRSPQSVQAMQAAYLRSGAGPQPGAAAPRRPTATAMNSIDATRSASAGDSIERGLQT